MSVVAAETLGGGPTRDRLGSVDLRLELAIVPVSDVDRAIAFYTEMAGFVLDQDHTVGDELRFVQLTPPGSACSIAIGTGLTDKPIGSASLQLVVDDARAAHDELAGRGVDVSDVQEFPWGSFVFFADPDGNRWAVQQIPPRPRGRGTWKRRMAREPARGATVRGAGCWSSPSAGGGRTTSAIWPPARSSRRSWSGRRRRSRPRGGSTRPSVWPRHLPTGPSFLLTPRSPWLQSGAAYLSIYNPSTYRPFDDTVGWEVPADHDGSPLLGLDAYFTAFPADAAVLSIDIAAKAWAGRTGSVAVSSQFPAQARIPIDGQFRAHTIHLAVPPAAQPGPRLVDAVVVIGPGVELLTFRALALGVGFLLEGVMLDPASPNTT